MKIGTLVPAVAAVVVLGTAGWMAPQAAAQAFKRDVIHVTLPYQVRVGEKTLPPGDYTIEPMPEAGDPPVLMISDGNGMKVKVMAMTSMSARQHPPASASVTLYRLGNNYYLDQVWIEGNPYGYRLLLPESVRNREKEMESVSVPAK